MASTKYINFLITDPKNNKFFCFITIFTQLRKYLIIHIFARCKVNSKYEHNRNFCFPRVKKEFVARETATDTTGMIQKCLKNLPQKWRKKWIKIADKYSGVVINVTDTFVNNTSNQQLYELIEKIFCHLFPYLFCLSVHNKLRFANHSTWCFW